MRGLRGLTVSRRGVSKIYIALVFIIALAGIGLILTSPGLIQLQGIWQASVSITHVGFEGIRDFECYDCHQYEEPHPNCESCHTEVDPQEHFSGCTRRDGPCHSARSPASIRHSAHTYVTDGSTISCASCHASDSLDCDKCHQLGFSEITYETFGVVRYMGHHEGEKCGDCHAPFSSQTVVYVTNTGENTTSIDKVYVNEMRYPFGTAYGDLTDGLQPGETVGLSLQLAWKPGETYSFRVVGTVTKGVEVEATADFTAPPI